MKPTTRKLIEVPDEALAAVMERADAETFETEQFQTAKVLDHA